MSFTVGLAIFAGGLSVSLLSYIRATASEERSVRASILLESAAYAALARLANGDTINARHAEQVGRRMVDVQVTPTSVRADLAADDPNLLRRTGASVGLTIDPELAKRSPGLAAFSARSRLNASAEDCLRQVFTYGRGGQGRALAVPQGLKVEPGDQVDLRISAREQPSTVLWLRARFTDGTTGWALHDYRRLQDVTPCRQR